MTAQAMDQLCGGALFLQSGSLQGSIVICYEKVTRICFWALLGFELGVKICYRLR